MRRFACDPDPWCGGTVECFSYPLTSTSSAWARCASRRVSAGAGIQEQPATESRQSDGRLDRKNLAPMLISALREIPIHTSTTLEPCLCHDNIEVAQRYRSPASQHVACPAAVVDSLVLPAAAPARVRCPSIHCPAIDVDRQWGHQQWRSAGTNPSAASRCLNTTRNVQTRHDSYSPAAQRRTGAAIASVPSRGRNHRTPG